MTMRTWLIRTRSVSSFPFLVPKLLFGNALPRNSVSEEAKQSFATLAFPNGVWERERRGCRAILPATAQAVQADSGFFPQACYLTSREPSQAKRASFCARVGITAGPGDIHCDARAGGR